MRYVFQSNFQKWGILYFYDGGEHSEPPEPDARRRARIYAQRRNLDVSRAGKRFDYWHRRTEDADRALRETINELGAK